MQKKEGKLVVVAYALQTRCPPWSHRYRGTASYHVRSRKGEIAAETAPPIYIDADVAADTRIER